jgi:hypothetical protein
MWSHAIRYKVFEAVGFSETLTTYYLATYHIPDDSTVHTHCHENLKSCKLYLYCTQHFFQLKPFTYHSAWYFLLMLQHWFTLPKTTTKFTFKYNCTQGSHYVATQWYNIQGSSLYRGVRDITLVLFCVLDHSHENSFKENYVKYR